MPSYKENWFQNFKSIGGRLIAECCILYHFMVLHIDLDEITRVLSALLLWEVHWPSIERRSFIAIGPAHRVVMASSEPGAPLPSSSSLMRQRRHLRLKQRASRACFFQLGAWEPFHHPHFWSLWNCFTLDIDDLRPSTSVHMLLFGLYCVLLFQSYDSFITLFY